MQQKKHGANKNVSESQSVTVARETSQTPELFADGKRWYPVAPLVASQVTKRRQYGESIANGP